MKNYVTPELRCILLNTQDVITASNDVEYDVLDWLGSESTEGDFTR